MCYDPWEEGIYAFSQLYLNAITESRRTDRTASHRHQWAGRAEQFEKSYPDKLAELDDEDLEEWLNDIEEYFDGEAKERLLVPAEEAQKGRAEEAANV